MRSLLLLGVLVGCALAADVQWTYEYDFNKPEAVQQSNWYSIPGSQCGGREQSPIDIRESEAEMVKWDPLIFEGVYAPSFRDKSPVYQFYNDGHTVGAKFIDLWKHGVTMSGGGLKAKYHPVAMHFHWGADGMSGSEHLINGKAFPAELHIVHVHEAYNGDVNAALASTRPERDDLAVLSFMLKEGKHNKALQTLYDMGMSSMPQTSVVTPLFGPPISGPQGVLYNGSKQEYTEDYLSDVLLIYNLFPMNMKKYARYMGSLTTPMCQEKVAWTVMMEPIEVSSMQLEALRSNYSMNVQGMPFKRIDANYRQLQDRNGRSIWMSEVEDDMDGPGPGRIWVGGMDGYWTDMDEVATKDGMDGGDWTNMDGWGGAGTTSLSLGLLVAVLAVKLLM